MEKTVSFIKELIGRIQGDEIGSLANEMTYKGLLSVFPLLIFIMSLLGFFNIDGNLLYQSVGPYLPEQVLRLFTAFIDEVIDTKSKTILSTSLIVMIFSASSGFRAIMRGINKSYGVEEKRGLILSALISVLLVLVFAATVLISLTVLIFGDIIRAFIMSVVDTTGFTWYYYTYGLNFLVTFIMLFAIMLIYKLSLNRKTSFVALIPGAGVTLILWLFASKIFNIYINSFSQYSVIYGSIGSIFILLIWLNIIAFILLIGSEINAMFEEMDQKSIKHEKIL